MGTHLRILTELSSEYQHDRVSLVFKNLCVFVLQANVASALEGLTTYFRIPKIFEGDLWVEFRLKYITLK